MYTFVSAKKGIYSMGYPKFMFTFVHLLEKAGLGKSTT
jgi:hypothetical protein